MPLLDVILGYDCNVACDYCTITPSMRARSLPTPVILAAMRDARARGYERVAFTGGEPTIRQDLLGLVRAARKLGFEDVKVQSNGLLLGEARNVARMIEAGVSTFHVSIHTHLEEAYERMVRRAGVFPLMRASLEALAQAGVDPIADVILTRETHPRLPDAIRWLSERGVRRADLWLVSLTDNNATNVDSLPRLSEVVPSVARAEEVAREVGVTLRSLHLPRCVLGPLAHLAHDPAADRVMVLTPDDRFELEGSKLTPSTYVAACDGCEDRPRCRGLRPDYLAHHGDEDVARARGLTPSQARRRLPVAS